MGQLKSPLPVYHICCTVDPEIHGTVNLEREANRQGQDDARSGSGPYSSRGTHLGRTSVSWLQGNDCTACLASCLPHRQIGLMLCFLASERTVTV